VSKALRSVADVPRLVGAVEAVRSIHKPFGIYDECGHDHTEEDLASGFAVDANLHYACADALMYRICTECCTEGMGQSEACVSSHEHGPGKPFCRTIEAITRKVLGERDE